MEWLIAIYLIGVLAVGAFVYWDEGLPSAIVPVALTWPMLPVIALLILFCWYWVDDEDVLDPEGSP